MRKKRSSVFGVKTPVIGFPIAGKTEAREEEEGRRREWKNKGGGQLDKEEGRKKGMC